MQKKPEKIKHKNVILQFYGAKNNLKNYFRKIKFQKFCGAREKNQRRLKNKTVILQNIFFKKHFSQSDNFNMI